MGSPVLPNVGLAVGSPVAKGSRVGARVGFPVGPEVGLLVGIEVGPGVGRAVGSSVGLKVGHRVGGGLVGDAVGREVGSTVGGLGVGSSVAHFAQGSTVGRKVGGGPNPASSSRNFSDVGAGVTTASLWPRSLPSAGRGAARRAATRRQSAARVGRPTGTAFMALEAVGYWMVSGNGLGIKHEMCVMWLMGLRVKKHQQRAAGWRPLA